MKVPVPTPIYRIVHLDNLHIFLKRGGLHAPNCTPDDGLCYRAIHNIDIQRERSERPVSCGPGGVIHDYISFYFSTRSPMLYQLHTGWVKDYSDGQSPIIYLVSTVQMVQKSGAGFVFSNGHGIARFTDWFANLDDLSNVDWEVIKSSNWKDTLEDMDRQRRKQAEFLVHKFCDWVLIDCIVGINAKRAAEVESILSKHPSELNKRIDIQPSWYY